MRHVRRLLAISILALAVLGVTVGGAGASHGPGSGPPNQDFTTGTGKLPEIPSGGGTFHFDAHSDPNGLNPRGHYFARDAIGGTVTFRAKVVCMRVFPHLVLPDTTVAIIGTQATRVEEGGLLEEGDFQIFRVVDRGEPGSEGDTFVGNPDPVENANDCQTLQPVLPDQPLEQGNFTVHDAPPSAAP